MSRKVLLSACILSAGATLLHAQAMVEYGASAGRSAASAGAAGAGRSAATIFDKVNKSLGGAAKADSLPKTGPSAPTSAAPAISAAVVPAPTPLERAAPPDFSALVTGMDREDLLKKVGKPSMSMSSMESSKLVETYWYRSGAESVTVILRDAKVAEITAAEKIAAK
jgi:hypothetical protein